MSDLNDSPQFLSECETFVETCTYALQEDNLDGIIREKAELESLFQEKHNAMLQLEEEYKQKSEHCSNLKITQKALLQKISYVNKNVVTANERIGNLQDVTTDLFNTDKLQSDEFVKASSKFDEDSQNLYSQFEEKTLADQINEVNSESQVIQGIEDHLKNQLQKLISEELIKTYERLPIIKTLVEEIGPTENVEGIRKKISEKENNIQFLKNEVAKQTGLLKDLGYDQDAEKLFSKDYNISEGTLMDYN